MTTTVPVIQTPSAGAPFERTTVERRDVGPTTSPSTSRSPASATPTSTRPARSGASAIFPMVPGHEIAGIVTEVGSESRATRSATASASAASSTPAASARTAWPARSSSALGHRRAPTTADGYDGEPTLRRLQQADRRRRELRAVDPRRPRARRRRAAALRRASPSTPRCKHWGAGPGKKVAVVGLGGLGHMAVKIAHAMGAEVTVLSQTLSKQADGRARRRPLLRDERPGHLQGSCAALRPHHQHRLGRPGPRRLPRHCSRLDGAMVFVGAAREHAVLRAVLAHRRPPQPRRLQHRRHRRDPGDARLLRRARHRRRRSRRSAPTTSTTPTSASSPATSATASSSTPPRSSTPRTAPKAPPAPRGGAFVVLRRRRAARSRAVPPAHRPPTACPGR